MKLTLPKRAAIWLTVLSVVGLSVGAYVDYERTHTVRDVIRLLPPAQTPYHLKSRSWLFDRYYKWTLPDDMVARQELPAFEDDHYILAFNLPKFLFLSLGSSAVIWSICLASAWFLAGFREHKDNS
jgi:hypothetical protein